MELFDSMTGTQKCHEASQQPQLYMYPDKATRQGRHFRNVSAYAEFSCVQKIRTIPVSDPLKFNIYLPMPITQKQGKLIEVPFLHNYPRSSGTERNFARYENFCVELPVQVLAPS